MRVGGTFTPAKRAAELSEAPHFAASVPVLVRFSNPTGVPNLPDADPNASPHGMAIRFQLPDGSSTDIVSISANSFPVVTPEEFVAMLQTVARSGGDAPKPTPIEQFLGSHPAARKFVTTPRPAPESFATLAFFGVNALKFTNATGRGRFARYEILPVAGEHALSDAGVAKAKPNYLMDLPKGIEPSDDPVLLFRPEAYAVSFGQRAQWMCFPKVSTLSFELCPARTPANGRMTASGQRTKPLRGKECKQPGE